jgi:hypothetical protein
VGEDETDLSAERREKEREIMVHEKLGTVMHRAARPFDDAQTGIHSQLEWIPGPAPAEIDPQGDAHCYHFEGHWDTVVEENISFGVAEAKYAFGWH